MPVILHIFAQVPQITECGWYFRQVVMNTFDCICMTYSDISLNDFIPWLTLNENLLFLTEGDILLQHSMLQVLFLQG